MVKTEKIVIGSIIIIIICKVEIVMFNRCIKCNEFIRKYILKAALGEEIKSFGKRNSQRNIYIVRRPDSQVGLFSHIITILGHLYRASEMNWDVVIDMKNYSNIYQQKQKDNSWDYFFEQPSKITLKDAYESKNVVLSSEDIPQNRPNDSIEFFYDYKCRKIWHDLYTKYFRYSIEVQRNIQQQEEKLFGEMINEKVLGVLCRGTDYTKLRPKNHPVQPSTIQMIEKIYEIKKEYRVDKIFLVTEDQEVLDKFKECFPKNELKYMDTKRFHSTKEEYLVRTMKSKKIDTKIQGIDYLTQIVLLSKCNYFLAGRTSGSVGVAIITEGFEYEYYWDLGRY